MLVTNVGKREQRSESLRPDVASNIHSVADDIFHSVTERYRVHDVRLARVLYVSMSHISNKRKRPSRRRSVDCVKKSILGIQYWSF